MRKRKLIRFKNDKKEIEIKEMDINEIYEQFGFQVKKIAHGFKNSNESLEDLIQIGNIGLIKAFNAYKLDTGNCFTTLVAIIVQNEMLMQMRKEKKTLKTINLEYSLATDSEGNEITILDVISGPNICETTILKNDEIKELESCLNKLEPHNKRLLLLHFNGVSQRDIGKEFGFAQSYISRLIKKQLKILRTKYINLELQAKRRSS